jgi:hypothetical protein
MKPRGGARASICPTAGVSEAVGASGDGSGGATVEAVFCGEGGVPALIAAACAWKVVDTTGHPFPDPLRFWSVTIAALRRASWDALEPSSGKEMGTEGLFITWPAKTFAFSS